MFKRLKFGDILDHNGRVNRSAEQGVKAGFCDFQIVIGIDEYLSGIRQFHLGF